MEGNKVSQSFIAIKEKVNVRALPVPRTMDVSKPMLSGIIYGETVFWIMIISMAIAIPGFVIYMIQGGGYFNSVNLLSHLWGGSDCSTIWKEVGGVSQPLPWYKSFELLNKGDMLATVGIAMTGIAAVAGMWGAFLGTLRGKAGIYIIFAFIIAVALTLSALGILKLEM